MIWGGKYEFDKEPIIKSFLSMIGYFLQKKVQNDNILSFPKFYFFYSFFIDGSCSSGLGYLPADMLGQSVVGTKRGGSNPPNSILVGRLS